VIQSSNATSWEPGQMTGNDAVSTVAGSGPPAGTTFVVSVDGGPAPNGYHASTNSGAITLYLICIPILAQAP